MSDHVAWLVGNNQPLITKLEKALINSVGCEVVCLTLDQFLKDEVPVSAPQRIVFDLQETDDWQHLEAIAKRLNQGNLLDTTRLVLIDQGYPIEVAATAERVFDHYFRFKGTPAGLPQVLDEADRLHKAKNSVRGGGYRELEVAGKRYVTYTPSLFSLFEKIERAAHHDFTILLVGGTGTGKTTFARLVHDLSKRSDERFLTAACGAMPRELMGSELFGHVRGAFTGADRDKDGKFTVADKGTLLLDEIDVLDLEQQANLLRVIETGEYEKVGANETLTANVRTIVASNIDLEDAIDTGSFRADLYFRLNEVKFEIPLLKDRPLDIGALATDIIEECREQQGLDVQFVDPLFLESLRCYSWPGNIRELRNEVRHAALFCPNGIVTPDLLSEKLLAEAGEVIAAAEAGQDFGLQNEVAKTEQEAIEDMLRLHEFNRAATARALGISRVTLYNKIRKYQIKIK